MIEVPLEDIQVTVWGCSDWQVEKLSRCLAASAPVDCIQRESGSTSSSNDLLFRFVTAPKLDCSGPGLQHNTNKSPWDCLNLLCYPIVTQLKESLSVFLLGLGVSAHSCNVVWDTQSWFPQQVPMCWEGDRASSPVCEAPLLSICIQVACKTPLVLLR